MSIRVVKNIKNPKLIDIDIDTINCDDIEKNGYSCEYIKESETTRLFFDFDYKAKGTEDLDSENIKEEFELYMNNIIPVLNKNSSIHDFVYTNGSWYNDKTYKISFHVIFKSKFIKLKTFNLKHEESKKYIDNIFNGIVNTEIKQDISSSGDESVYGNKWWFRLPHGGWFDDSKPCFHTIQRNTQLKDYFVSDTRSISENQIINKDWESERISHLATQAFPLGKKSELSRRERRAEGVPSSERRAEGDIRDINEMLEKLEMVKKERFQEYKNWMDLFFLIKGQNLQRELFLKYSLESRFKTFSEDECNSLWYKTDAKKGYGFPLIHRWLEEDGVDLKNVFCKKKSDMINDLLKAYYSVGTLTDLVVSEIFYRNYKDSLYFTQQGWLHYNNYRGWEVGTDDDILHPLMKLIGEKFISYACEMKMKKDQDEKEEKEYKLMVKRLKLEGVRLCTAVVCQKIIKTSKTLFKNDEIINEFDNKPYWFCFKNMKAIDLKTKEVIDIKKEDKITKHCGYNIPQRNEEFIIKATDFIKSIQGKDIDSYMSCISTSLCGNPSLNQFIYIHTGSGGNGKSLVFKALRYSLGHYHGMLPIDNLTKTSNGKDSADSSLVSLNGIRCAQANEPEDEKDTTIKVARVKEYTGEQFIKCRDLHKSAFQMRITFNLNLLCNEKPKLSKSDEGIERRIRVIPYPYKFVDNPSPNNPLLKLKDYELEDYITTNENFRNGFLYLLINHWNINQGKYIMNEDQKQETDEYIKSNNPLSEFLEDYQTSLDKTINIKELYTRYKNNHTSNLTSQQFLKFLTQLNFQIKEDNKKGHQVYIDSKY